jgi:hypothetical protein
MRCRGAELFVAVVVLLGGPCIAEDSATRAVESPGAAVWFDRAEKDLRDAESEADKPDTFSLAMELYQLSPTESRKKLAASRLGWAIGNAAFLPDPLREQMAMGAVYRALLGDPEAARSFLKRYDKVKNERRLDRPIDYDDPAAAPHIEALLLLGDRDGFDKPEVTVAVLSLAVHKLLEMHQIEQARFLARYEKTKAVSESEDMYRRTYSRKTAAADLELVGASAESLRAAGVMEEGLAADELYPHHGAQFMTWVAVAGAANDRNDSRCFQSAADSALKVMTDNPAGQYFGSTPENDVFVLLEILAARGERSRFDAIAKQLSSRIDHLTETMQLRKAPAQARLSALYAAAGDMQKYKALVDQTEAQAVLDKGDDQAIDYWEAATARARAADQTGTDRNILKASEVDGFKADDVDRRREAVFTALVDAGAFEGAAVIYSKIKDDDFQLRNHRRMARRLAQAGRYAEAWRLTSPMYPWPSLQLIYEFARIEALAGRTEELSVQITKTKSAYDRAVIEISVGTALSSHPARDDLFFTETD